MYVIILLTTIKIQADAVNCGKPGGRQTVLEFSLVAISMNVFMNDNE